MNADDLRFTIYDLRFTIKGKPDFTERTDATDRLYPTNEHK